MFSMYRHLGKSLTFVLFQRSTHSQVTSIAARAASDQKATEVPQPVVEKVQDVKLSREQRKGLVAAAFASLQENSSDIDEEIVKAKSVNGILSIAGKYKYLTREQTLKIISKLSEWTSTKQATVAEYDKDERFVKLCRTLGRAVDKKPPTVATKNRSKDLDIVLSVAGEDEVSKLVSNISVKQMVKIMSALSAKKRRSIPLLRQLSHHISGNSEKLNLKLASDLLYSMAVLNFPDPVLIDRISSDIIPLLPENTEKSATIGSILTSLGLLRYRDITVLEALTDWMLKNYEKCRVQDVAALYQTLGVLNYPTSYIEELKTKVLKQAEVPSAVDWLNHVWALVLLNVATEAQMDSVLKVDFLELLVIERQSTLSHTLKMKLLNINAYAKSLTNTYKGSLLADNSTVFDLPLEANKEKLKTVYGMIESLKSLLSIETYVKTNVNTNMGFVIDADCCFDAKGNPIAIERADSTCKRVAIVVHDFHELCQGIHTCPTGLTNLSIMLLEKSGRHVLSLPYNEFKVSEKLLKRVQYIDEKLKIILGKSK